MGGAGIGPFGEGNLDVRMRSLKVRKGMKKGTVVRATRRVQGLMVSSSMTIISWTKGDE